MAGLSPTYWAFTCKSLWDHVPYSFITRGCYRRLILGSGSKELGLTALYSYYGKLKRKESTFINKETRIKCSDERKRKTNQVTRRKGEIRQN
jgi:hypothetical protein